MKREFFKKHGRSILYGVALFTIATNAFASTTGTEFSPLYTWLLGEVQGYAGKTVSVAAVGVGALIAMVRANPMMMLGGIGFAIFLQYVPTIISGILSATI